MYRGEHDLTKKLCQRTSKKVVQFLQYNGFVLYWKIRSSNEFYTIWGKNMFYHSNRCIPPSRNVHAPPPPQVHNDQTTRFLRKCACCSFGKLNDDLCRFHHSRFPYRTLFLRKLKVAVSDTPGPSLALVLLCEQPPPAAQSAARTTWRHPGPPRPALPLSVFCSQRRREFDPLVSLQYQYQVCYGNFFTARIAIKVVGIGHNGFFKK